MQVIDVKTSRPYRVHIGAGLLAEVPALLAPLASPPRKVLIVSDSNVAPLYLQGAKDALQGAGYDVSQFIVEAGEASFEIQFGTIERPTHKNTSWDRQKFETCAQKFADLSEGDYGVSLLNDCKYGHDVHGNLMQLTLLKRPTYPNEIADQGHHSFTYSLLPHRGPLSESDTVRQGYLLNYPMYAVKVGKPGDRPVFEHGDRPLNKIVGSAMNAGAGTHAGIDSKASSEAFKPLSMLGDTWSLVSCSTPNLVIETVKEAEYSGDIIVRGYEANNCRGNASVRFGFTPAEVWLSDLSENKIKQLEIVDNTVSVPFKPFEILTLRVVL